MRGYPQPAMPDLPSGTVTFVFSDLEGSTRLLTQLGDEPYTQLLAIHRKLMRETFARHAGSEIDTQGDAFFYSFARARAAVAAAVEVQRLHAQQAWPGGVTVSVRLGLHTGEPVVGEEGYTGLDVVRAARIAADGKGGQILLSEATRAIVGGNLPEGVAIREIGSRTLKDIDRPEPLFELVYETGQREQTVLPGPPIASADMAPQEPGSFVVDTGSLMQQARRLAKLGGSFDPSKMIQERVLNELERALSEDPDLKRLAQSKSPPAEPDSPLADKIGRLNKLREEGVLSDEQYARAVDKLLAEG